MASIRLDFPDAVAPRIINAFARYYGYEPKIENENFELVDNPETKQQFAKRKIAEYVMQVVTTVEGRDAGTIAQDDAVRKARTDITIT